MHDLPLYKRIYYWYLGFVYGFTHWTSTHTLFGIRFSSLVKLLSFVPALIVWWQEADNVILAGAFLFGLGVLWLYWRAKRAGYIKFVGGKTAVNPQEALKPLSPNQRVSLKASGLFGVSNREEQILMWPAQYWQVPVGDHTVMAQSGSPSRFLYQFFNALSLRDLQIGWLIHGPKPQEVLAVTFLSVWGTEQLSLRDLYHESGDANSRKKPRTIYLAFDDERDKRAVWHTIMHDLI